MSRWHGGWGRISRHKHRLGYVEAIRSHVNVGRALIAHEGAGKVRRRGSRVDAAAVAVAVADVVAAAAGSGVGVLSNTVVGKKE